MEAREICFFIIIVAKTCSFPEYLPMPASQYYFVNKITNLLHKVDIKGTLKTCLEYAKYMKICFRMEEIFDFNFPLKFQFLFQF